MRGERPPAAPAAHRGPAFDNETSDRMVAEIMATISSLAHVRHERIELEPMSLAGTVTCSGFANFRGRDRYEIKLSIALPIGETDSSRLFSDHRQ
ncbi:hypothetical protein [Manganibacter manganicus]|uniref:Uncharacterized protein n=1 Tax=Manganibacter manganicus TaxID=1873176 RepID=A0A1V8RJM1_9HYPH|nr:hypothetical protein [Pseudaminobacter manganicus]OQM73412.1 hypothetical protein BFN67_08970 [Pseudaminobacter manganicus]